MRGTDTDLPNQNQSYIYCGAAIQITWKRVCSSHVFICMLFTHFRNRCQFAVILYILNKIAGVLLYPVSGHYGKERIDRHP